MNEAVYKVALSLIPGVGNITARQLISYLGSAEAIFKSPPSKLLKVPGIGKASVKAFKEVEPFMKRAQELISKAEKAGDKLLFITDEEYPQRVREIPDAPHLLFYRGSVSLNHPRTVALVGTRECTEYGQKAVKSILEALKELDVLVVSGLAYGIDIAAHRLCLQMGIPTLGVMATGLEAVYPAAHGTTAKQMVNSGGLITEHEYGSKPDAFKFPARNRIIAALSDLTIVVEARNTGGALITAELAMGYNREVMAVPGSIFSEASEGCHKLIANNTAAIINNPNEIATYMGWANDNRGAGKSLKKQSLEVLLEGLDEPQSLIIKQLAQAENLHIDELTRTTLLPVNQLATQLLNLEFMGKVKALPGKKFSLS